MKRTRLPGGDHEAVFDKLSRIKEQEQKLRDEKVALLRLELANAREHVQSIERELRLLGDSEAARGAGRIAWDDVYRRLGARFAAKEMRDLTGASPNLVASIIFRWKQQGRIGRTGRRGVYRKLRDG